MLEIIDPDNSGIKAQLRRWLTMKHPPTPIFILNKLTPLRPCRVSLSAASACLIRLPSLGSMRFNSLPPSPLALTVVVQPAAEIGKQAEQRLLSRFDAKTKLLSKRVLLDATLVIRSSCGCNHSTTSKPTS